MDLDAHRSPATYEPGLACRRAGRPGRGAAVRPAGSVAWPPFVAGERGRSRRGWMFLRGSPGASVDTCHRARHREPDGLPGLRLHRADAPQRAGTARRGMGAHARRDIPLGRLHRFLEWPVDRLFGAWALLRYPNSALLRYQRVYLIVLAGWMLIGRTLIAVTSTAHWNGGPASWWWPALIPDQQLTDVLNYVVNAGEGLLGLALLVLLVMRLVRTRGLDRIVIAPIIVAGITAVIAASASAVAQMLVSLSTTPNGAYLTESAVDLVVPLAFLAAVVQRALLLRNITGLTAQISAGADVGAVRHALRSTLHDPTLDLLDLSAPSPSPAGVGTRTVAGGDREASLAVQALDVRPEERLVEFIRTDGGRPIAVVIADPALARYRGLFDAAVQTSGLALKNAQLQAKAAREKLEQIRASRTRIIEAELAERRRLERDLHDGVQQHLLSITAGLSTAMTKTTDQQATAAFGQARDALKDVLAELRDLAHGIHPALLSQGGLAAALEAAAERLPPPA